MSSDFVRYSEEIETFDPKLAEYMTRIIDFWETKVRESPTREGSGRAVRGAHAKTIGVARAEGEIAGEARAAGGRPGAPRRSASASPGPKSRSRVMRRRPTRRVSTRPPAATT